jgi:FkbM family methyltransferase
MTPERIVAQGAGRFRQDTLLERVARRAARVEWSPTLRRGLTGAYHAILRLRAGGRGFTSTLPGGETIRVDPTMAPMYWNPDEYRAFRAAVRPGMVALDIGANVGAYALLLGQWTGQAGHVYAFEPAPRPFDALGRHIALNGLEGVVTPIAAAVGERSATASFLIADTVGESRLAAPGLGGHTVDVSVTTIDEFCAAEGVSPDFIKIDVEGHELAVLRGARETIRARQGRLTLFVEMHPSSWCASGFGIDEVRAELDGLGLAVESLTSAPDPWAVEGICLRLVPKSK